MNPRMLGYLAFAGGIILVYSSLKGYNPVDLIKAGLTEGTLKNVKPRYSGIGGMIPGNASQGGKGIPTPANDKSKTKPKPITQEERNFNTYYGGEL